MADVPVSGRGRPISPSAEKGFGKTQRTDPWWREWMSVVGGLAVLGLYATWASFQKPFNPGSANPYHPEGTPYLSPFNSPEILLWGHHPWFLPAGFVALLAILGFRGTCYYYRKAYYRAFFADPAGCAVGESRYKYEGETKWFKFQNAHRYFFYIALIALIFLWMDVAHAFDWDGRFGIGFGTIIMLINVCLISGYTLGCHSLRHLIGGGSDCMSCIGGRAKAWGMATKFNMNHQQWAWASLISVCATDLYLRLVGLHIFADPHLIFVPHFALTL